MNTRRFAVGVLAIACIGPWARARAQDTIAMERVGLINELFHEWAEAPIHDERVLGWKPLDGIIEAATARLDGQDTLRAYRPPGVSSRDIGDVPIEDLRGAAARIVRDVEPILDRLAKGLDGPVDGLDRASAARWTREFPHYYRSDALAQLIVLAGVTAADRGDLSTAGQRYRLALRLAAELDASDLMLGVGTASKIQSRVFPHLVRWLNVATREECRQVMSELAEHTRTRTSMDRLIEADLTVLRLDIPEIVAAWAKQAGPELEAYLAEPGQAALRARMYARVLLALHLSHDSLLRAWRRGGWDALNEQARVISRAMEAHAEAHKLRVLRWGKLVVELLAAGRPVDLPAIVDWEVCAEYLSYGGTAGLISGWTGMSTSMPGGLARLRLMRLAAALRLFGFEHESYPSSLEALGTALGKDALLDPYARDSRPLRYEGGGARFRLWSIGPDRCDQGGWDVLRYEEDPEPGDVVAAGGFR